MKVVRKSNFNHEDHRGDQYFVAQKIGLRQAEAVAKALNDLEDHRYSDDFYEVVLDDYVLPPDWEP